MNEEQKLAKRINLLQKVSLGFVGLYFTLKYLFKVNEWLSSFFILPLLFVVLYRAYLQYKLTGSYSRIVVFLIALLLSIAIGLYFYLNPGA